MVDSIEAEEAMTEVADENSKSAQRRKAFRILAIVLLVLGLLWLLWWVFIGSASESTDNAYVGGDVASITPLINASVKDVPVSETQTVHQGDPLVLLDDSDAKIAVEQAQAALQQAQRKVRGYLATDTGLSAQQSARQADTDRAKAQVNQAQAAYDKAQSDFTRRNAIAADGAVSGQEVVDARNALAGARADLAAAKAAYTGALANQRVAAGAFDTNNALVAGTTVDNNPEVAAAQAKLDAAKLDLSRTIIRAPFDGVVSQRHVQIGQQVQAGMVLMSIVPSNKLYVDANFKETQLRKVQVGQAVTLTSDRYGSGVVYHGKVIGFAGGTGAAFAVIPAQNATGNWIKVVQRVPLRIALEPSELKAHPLLIGLSMTATVDLSN